VEKKGLETQAKKNKKEFHLLRKVKDLQKKYKNRKNVILLFKLLCYNGVSVANWQGELVVHTKNK
jgi:hypothetical protein